MAVASIVDGTARVAKVSHSTMVRRRFRKQVSGVVSLVVLSLLVLLVIIVPIFSPFDSYTANATQAYAPAGTVDSLSGSVHWLGTDFIGRDFLVRLFIGGRIPLAVSMGATLLLVIIGTFLGLLAGYYGGWVDIVLMRFTDFILAIPMLPMYLLVLRWLRELPGLQPWWKSAEINPPLTLAVITGVFALLGWPGLARLVRSSVLSLRSQAFVEAAKALGASNYRIIFKHLLPNSFAPIAVAATFAVGDFIILEAILAYFVQGISEPPFPTWGNMLALVQGLAINVTNLNPFEEIRAYLFLLPTLMIFLTVICINYVGDGLRNALDPHGNM
jgi:peptide/nickel transport system permease protein